MGLSYTNSTKYCPSDNETTKGHLTHTWKGVRSTKLNPKSSAKTTANINPDIGPLNLI